MLLILCTENFFLQKQLNKLLDHETFFVAIEHAGLIEGMTV